MREKDHENAEDADQRIDLQDAVTAQLDWDARVNPVDVRVSVKDGAVRLSGSVHSYRQKTAAVRAAERVAGVRTVVDDLDVTLPSAVARKDREIAAAITRERSSTTAIPDSVQAEVRKGHVTLRGEVQWAHQREDAARAIAHVRGVRGVVNQITVKPLSEEQEADPADVERRVEDAIRRLAELDARSISVTTSVGVVRLEGSVHSLAEFQLAQRAAESAPGVTKVENELVVTA